MSKKIKYLLSFAIFGLMISAVPADARERYDINNVTIPAKQVAYSVKKYKNTAGTLALYTSSSGTSVKARVRHDTVPTWATNWSNLTVGSTMNWTQAYVQEVGLYPRLEIMNIRYNNNTYKYSGIWWY